MVSEPSMLSFLLNLKAGACTLTLLFPPFEALLPEDLASLIAPAVLLLTCLTSWLIEDAPLLLATAAVAVSF